MEALQHFGVDVVIWLLHPRLCRSNYHALRRFGVRVLPAFRHAVKHAEWGVDIEARAFADVMNTLWGDDESWLDRYKG